MQTTKDVLAKLKEQRRARVAERNTLAALRAPALLKSDGLLRLPEVLAVVGVGKSHWWQMVRDGRAPKSLSLSPRCTVWTAESIRNFLSQTTAAAFAPGRRKVG